MAIGLPIVTTDFVFSREACGNAALFYDSGSAMAAATALVSLMDDAVLWDEMIDRGKAVLQQLPRPEDKVHAYMAQIKHILM